MKPPRQSRLDVYGLDLRDLKSVNAFCATLADRYDRVDMISAYRSGTGSNGQ